MSTLQYNYLLLYDNFKSHTLNAFAFAHFRMVYRDIFYHISYYTSSSTSRLSLKHLQHCLLRLYECGFLKKYYVLN